MKKGFTLAEVLITLGIIGVVATMTLPALLQNNKEKARVTALKKQYSILNQAYQRIVLIRVHQTSGLKIVVIEKPAQKNLQMNSKNI